METTGCFNPFDSCLPWLITRPRFLLSGNATPLRVPYCVYWYTGLQGRNEYALLAASAGVIMIHLGAAGRSGAPPLPACRRGGSNNCATILATGIRASPKRKGKSSLRECLFPSSAIWQQLLACCELLLLPKQHEMLL